MRNKIMISVISLFIFIDVALVYLVLTISPVKLKRNSFTYEYGEEISIDVGTYVNANDSVLKAIKLDLSHVLTEVGIYQASFEYNGTIYPFQIEIVDTIKPKVELKQIEFTLTLGTTIYAKDLIEKVEDQSKTTVYFVNDKTGEKSKEKSYTKEGSNIERIVVEDAHGNQSASLRVKIVVIANKVAPVIEGVTDVTIHLGETIDLLNGIKAIDDIEGDVTSRLKVEGTINNTLVGEYQIIYTVSDNVGNIAKVVRKVTVVE